MGLGSTSKEVWREHSRSVTYLLERAESEGGRASGTFGRPSDNLTGIATALALICQRCDGEKGRHATRDHEFVAPSPTRTAFLFVWVQGSWGRGEIELDASMSPLWRQVERDR
jgi:hypothetical protein